MANRKEWLKKRKQGIGGSDIGAVLGHSPYKNAYDVYIDKTTNEVIEEEMNGHMRRGKFLEPLVINMYKKETGHTGESTFKIDPEVVVDTEGSAKLLCENPILVQSTAEPWMLGSPDHFIESPDMEGVGVLECKAPGFSMFNKLRREGFPQYIIDQCQQYLAILGLKWGALAAFSTEHWELIHLMIEADPELHKEMAERGREFWEKNVLEKQPPQLDIADNAKSIAVKGKLVQLHDNDAWLNAVTQYREAKLLEAEAKDSMATARDRIKKIMGNVYAIEGSGMRFYNIQNNGRTGIDKKKLEKEFPKVYESVKTTGKPYNTLKGYDLKWKGGG